MKSLNKKVISRAFAFFLLGGLIISGISCEAKRDFPPLIEEGVVLDPSSNTVIIGEELIITPVFQPDIFPQKSYEWETSTPNLVDINVHEDYTATILAKQEGVAHIRFYSLDEELEATVEIIVTESGPEDITGNAVISVSKENGGGPTAGEGSPKLIDGDYNSKYLADYESDLWLQLELSEPRAVDLYTLTSGNDAPDRDAKNWTLEGSNDGETWEVLDTRNNQAWSERNQTKEFNVDNEKPFLFYRLVVTANNGSNLIQISEWRLMVISD